MKQASVKLNLNFKRTPKQVLLKQRDKTKE